MKDAGPYVVLYTVAVVWITGMTFSTNNPVEAWCNSRRTSEAQFVAFVLTIVFCPVVVLIHLLNFGRFLINPMKGAPGALWRGVAFLGRGIRDLLPTRVAKLPRAIVKK